MEPKKLPGAVKKNLFEAKIKERWEETKAGSTKSTFHLTLDTSGSDLSYKVGDSVAIYAPNDLNLFRITTALDDPPRRRQRQAKVLC